VLSIRIKLLKKSSAIITNKEIDGIKKKMD
jgi:hypothetical protein